MVIGSQKDDQDQDELSLEDLEKLEPIFMWFFILLHFVLMGALIWAGVTGKPWFIIIPVGGCFWFGAKVLKKIISNQFKTLIPIAKKDNFIRTEFETRRFDDDGSDIIIRAENIFFSEDTNEDQSHGVKLTPKLGILAIFFGAFLPAALWYGLGAGISRLIS